MGAKGIRLKRRTFLEAGLSAAVAASAISCKTGQAAADWRFFTAAEAQTVEAICAQLIPADRDPGAKESGVVNYIDIQLTRQFKKHQEVYRRGIAAVDASCRSKFGKRFVDLGSEAQIEAVNAAEESSGVFFDLILSHARQGFYGDPRHGGNRHMASWKMLGLPFPPVRGRQRYDEPKAG
ncbi:MAG: gluconate 2-dehydrogenase subunit 3 family protein [Bryobacteraceae bacterium]|jgi:gluconate 2-dehydrogenase gamma chain